MSRASKYTRELLEPLVAESGSIGQLLDALGLKKAGGNYRHLGNCVSSLKLDISHWGDVYRGPNVNPHPVFIEDSIYGTSKLAPRLISEGRVYQCSICGLDEWLGARRHLK